MLPAYRADVAGALFGIVGIVRRDMGAIRSS
jgi:hypothetical protein